MNIEEVVSHVPPRWRASVLEALEGYHGPKARALRHALATQEAPPLRSEQPEERAKNPPPPAKGIQ